MFSTCTQQVTGHKILRGNVQLAGRNISFGPLLVSRCQSPHGKTTRTSRSFAKYLWILVCAQSCQ